MQKNTTGKAVFVINTTGKAVFALTKKREPTILNGKAVKGTSKNRRNAQKAAGR